MSKPADPNSRSSRIAAYFEANKDEYLTYDDIAVKFGCTRQQARNTVAELKARGANLGSDVMVFHKAV